jgi:Putative peptidoglycan binding domain
MSNSGQGNETMKKLILLILALALPLAQIARADENQNQKEHKRTAEEQQREEAARKAAQAPHRTVNKAVRPVHHTAAPAPHTAGGVAPHAVAPVNRQPVKSEASLEGRNHQRTTASNQANINRARSTTSVQRSRGHYNYNRNSYYVARRYIVRTPHDRAWWRAHYNTTYVLFGGGYYYWWNNYWYPAYGYSPFYNNYVYNEPIYGYNNLAPGQVIENVQLALRDQGYYPGAIDGIIGTQTRAALAAYQRDHGLIVTSAIDEPTLVTLGLA